MKNEMRIFKCGRAGGSYANLGAGRPGGLRGAEPPVPYLQCCLCEKPLGCLQSMLRLYLSDHLWRRVRDLFGMYA
jgi:hypothetical protein